MYPRRLAAALAAAFTLALPAAALAQGAGDEQYTDPLAGQGGGGGGGNSGSSGSSGGGGSSGTSNSGSQGGAEGTTSGSGSQLSSSPPDMGNGSSANGAIPRTGADPGLVALLGAGLILTGAGVRVRVRRPVA